MRRSIRLRFTLIFISLMAMVLLCLWGVNSWLLEDFYMREKVKDLEQAYVLVDRLLKEEQKAGRNIAEEFKKLDEAMRKREIQELEGNTLIDLIRELNERSNITLLIMDSSNGTLISSERKGDALSERFLRNILGQNDRPFKIVSQTEDYTIQQSFDPRIRSFYLESWGFLADDSPFIMSMPVASVRESVELSNRFLAYVGGRERPDLLYHQDHGGAHPFPDPAVGAHVRAGFRRPLYRDGGRRDRGAGTQHEHPFRPFKGHDRGIKDREPAADAGHRAEDPDRRDAQGFHR